MYVYLCIACICVYIYVSILHTTYLIPPLQPSKSTQRVQKNPTPAHRVIMHELRGNELVPPPAPTPAPPPPPPAPRPKPILAAREVRSAIAVALGGKRALGMTIRMKRVRPVVPVRTSPLVPEHVSTHVSTHVSEHVSEHVAAPLLKADPAAVVCEPTCTLVPSGVPVVAKPKVFRGKGEVKGKRKIAPEDEMPLGVWRALVGPVDNPRLVIPSEAPSGKRARPSPRKSVYFIFF